MDTITLGEQKIDGGLGVQAAEAAPRANAMARTLSIISIIVMLLLVIAVAGLGVWSYQVNTKLTATQAQLVSLQADYGKLKADNARITTDLGQANLALDQTKSGLAKAQADLKAANSAMTTQRAKIDAARRLYIVADAIANGEDGADISAKVFDTGDAQLISLWKTFMRTANEENYLAFQKYLISTIGTALE